MDIKPQVKLEWRYRRIARSLRTADLRRDDCSELDPDGIYAALVDKWSAQYFLGFYSEQGVTTAFERYGFFDALERHGLHDPIVRFDLSDPYLHCMRTYCDGQPAPENLISELRARIVHRPATYLFRDELGDDPVDFLLVEWLLLQNPRRAFAADHPPLPSQEHPGLGLRDEVLSLLVILAERLGLAGIINLPMHFHNALMYRGAATFLDPEVEGEFRALRRDLASLPLLERSWAVHRACVIDTRSGERVEWRGHEQLCAICRRVRAYLRSDTFRERRDAAERAARFCVDEAKLARVMAELPDVPTCA